MIRQIWISLSSDMLKGKRSKKRSGRTGLYNCDALYLVTQTVWTNLNARLCDGYLPAPKTNGSRFLLLKGKDTPYIGANFIVLWILVQVIYIGTPPDVLLQLQLLLQAKYSHELNLFLNKSLISSRLCSIHIYIYGQPFIRYEYNYSKWYLYFLGLYMEIQNQSYSVLSEQQEKHSGWKIWH